MAETVMDPRHLKAIFFYMRGMTKKDSLIKAGFSESTAKTDAQAIFDRPDVQAEIKRRQDMAGERAAINEDWIVERLRRIAEAELGDVITYDEDGAPQFDLSKMTPEMRYALTGVKVRKYNKGRGPDAEPVVEMTPQLADKLRALEMLAKYLGMFTEKIEMTADDSLLDALRKGRKRAAARNRGEEEEG